MNENDVVKSLEEINAILKLGAEKLNTFTRSQFLLGKEGGYVETAIAVAEFAKQGLDPEETLKKIRDALVLIRLARIDANKAVEAISSAINAFSEEKLTSTEVVDKLRSVDACFAVSSRDLAEGLSRAGAAATDAGISFEQLIGLITSAQQTTARGGVVIGNALKTIFSRLERKEVRNELILMGVVNKETSSLRTLELIAKADLSPENTRRIHELLGGVYQINILKAILNDLKSENSIFSRAVKIAETAEKDCAEKNDKLITDAVQKLVEEQKKKDENF